ncbi:MAG: ATP-binding protein [Acidobacteriota bacterium]
MSRLLIGSNGGAKSTPRHRKVAELEQKIAVLEKRDVERREREARFRILSELVTDCCWVRWRSADGREERGWVNDAFAELTGYTPEEFDAIGRAGLVHPEDYDKIQDFIDGPVGVSEHEFRIVRRDGEVRWLHERMQVVESTDGSMTVYGATRDVTDEKRARAVLENAQRLLERRVDERTRELRRVNRLLEREIDERREIAAELRRAKELAEASNRAKSDFLATITHELRTPLHGIVGLTELLQSDTLPASARQRVGVLEGAAKALQHLVEGVLDLSRIEAGQLQLDARPFALAELTTALEALFAERAVAAGSRLVFDVDPTLPAWVSGDGGRLRQVLVNLLDNAVKFTREGSVALRVEPAAGDQIRFAVVDTGIGFDTEVAQRIFEPFTQADASTTRLYGGSGLGLAISRHLVTLMGGQLEAESTPGAGASFTFTLALPAAPALDVRGAVEAELAAFGGGRRMLVAEDNPVNQLVLREHLESLGFVVEVVDNGRRALDALAAGGFVAGLIDCAMPEMDGLEAARRWRAQEQGDRLPLIAVTATAVREQVTACLEAGIDDVLIKPFRRSTLLEMLRRWLG